MAATKTTGWSYGVLGPIAVAATISQPSAYTVSRMSQQPPSTAAQAAPPTGYVSMPLLDAKLEAADARTDSKFSQLLGEMKVLGERMVGLHTQIQAVDTKIGGVSTTVAALDAKIDAVDGHARTGKREIIISIISTGLAVAALSWAAVQIFQGGLGLGISAAQSAASAKQPPTSTK